MPRLLPANQAVAISATLTDLIVGGTEASQGATGTLTGPVNAAGLESLVRLAGTVTLAS